MEHAGRVVMLSESVGVRLVAVACGDVQNVQPENNGEILFSG
jgi:hypothetical protein